jgi:cytochrome P450
MPPLIEGFRLEDPEFYLSETAAPTLRQQRETAPVAYYEPLDTWVITEYDLIKEVGRAANLFCSSQGILLNDFRYGDVVNSFFPPGAENFALTDPPRHAQLRRHLIPAFSAATVSRLEDTIRRICSERLDSITPGQPVNWSKLMAEPLPLIVIALLMGIPLDDLLKIQEWSDEIIKMGAAIDQAEIAAAAGSLLPMGEYFESLLASRRAEPSDDLISTLEAARASGKISNETVHMMLAGIMTAGNETTRNVINGMVVALSDHPGQMRRLVLGEAPVRLAVEEFLRWVTPVRGFGRTVTADTELGGQALKAGQRVYMLFVEGNRDPKAFEAPEMLDVSRDMASNPHLSFGFGNHGCIGAALARLELRVLFEEMISRFTALTVAEMDRQRSLLVNAWSDVQVVFE